MPTVRIGIDVGGTFTDAVAIDTESFEVVAQTKVPTTHDADIGVAAGIVEATSNLLEWLSASPEDVVFIAHGTTQATNALLEGDVSKVGIVGLGKGIQGRRAKSETDIGDIELDDDQAIETTHDYLNIKKGLDESELDATFERFKSEGVGAIVASQAFGVDNAEMEEKVQSLAQDFGLPGIGANVVSKRYGLKIRTRTAVVNASILPRMIETSKATSESIEDFGIDSPLMIMRSDGGVMGIDEMQRRPIQTILSGPAAGVAGALMYENVTDGIFIDVGGTSSDISVIEKGQPKWKAAEIGGHSTFLRTLDIRTEGVAGGSMIRVEDGEVVQSGPRSAHIADLPYSTFADPEDIVDPELTWITPKEGDPEYAAIEIANGEMFALTPSCASNLLGLLDDDVYAAGNPEAARKAFGPLAAELGTDVEGAAREVLDESVHKIIPVIEEVIEEYDLDPALLEVVGGGGGCGALVPYLGEATDFDTRLAENHEIVSTVGVGLAMVRDVVERNVMNPSEDQIDQIRQEAIDSVVGMGANQETVEANIKYDDSENLLRVEAEGSTELQTREMGQETVSDTERKEKAAASLDVADENIALEETTGGLYVYETSQKTQKLFGLLSDEQTHVSIVDETGVVKLKLQNATVYRTDKGSLERSLKRVLDQESVYSGSATRLPNIYICHGNQIIDASGLSARDQIHSLVDIELEGLADETELLIVGQQP
ncbi:hydantoinase/oxoprolinase family protein [Haloarcula laminariae]|uniref:hydantoinase/oxoprolinase family protein n=1 Tax=Haloarcula laminariae TaxID=2961577 RepID=UPI0021CA11D8|nr:hydantoinase/oxoprolinase family protein [Halomicroarcula laminariae]